MVTVIGLAQEGNPILRFLLHEFMVEGPENLVKVGEIAGLATFTKLPFHSCRAIILAPKKMPQSFGLGLN
ncbi:MAG: hypothetical protein A2750_01500 [Candidatus Yanofskybacteria bacterium RIFCSPHIGHO2_01_FULL_45_42]|uniref:Uncharacterized protein n=1 Tax=Candidatus Yanofskybacteria bacterium RIFCSPHIGHO2_01_FULL_45_42 TaxID=1802671 RepID=A0A1F8F665_9BACT|nr:MAG: hypothetical protein A2750_01500 [Candidatus Yanofskybacteria bacterium RIFCSPHIGHO2_01_FULL_45_42]